MADELDEIAPGERLTSGEMHLQDTQIGGFAEATLPAGCRPDAGPRPPVRRAAAAAPAPARSTPGAPRRSGTSRAEQIGGRKRPRPGSAGCSLRGLARDKSTGRDETGLDVGEVERIE